MPTDSNQNPFIFEEPSTVYLFVQNMVNKTIDYAKHLSRVLEPLATTATFVATRNTYIASGVGIGVGIAYDEFYGHYIAPQKGQMVTQSYQAQLKQFETRVADLSISQRLLALSALDNLRTREHLPPEVITQSYEIQFKTARLVLHDMNQVLATQGHSIEDIIQTVDHLHKSQFKQVDAIQRLETQSQQLTDTIEHVLENQEATLQHQALVEQWQEQMGVQFNAMQKEGRLTRLAMGQLLTDVHHYQKQQAERRAQKNAMEQAKANFEGLYQAFGALHAVGRTFKNEALSKMGVLGQAGISIAMNVSILKGALPGMTAAPQGLAALGPYAAITVAGLSIISTFMGQDADDSLGDALESLSRQIEALHHEMRHGFMQTFANQEVIIKNQRTLLSNQQAIYAAIQQTFKAIIQDFRVPVMLELNSISTNISRLQNLTTLQFQQQTITLGVSDVVYYLEHELTKRDVSYADVKKEMLVLERWILEETVSPFYNLANLWQHYKLDWLKQAQPDVGGQLPAMLGYMAGVMQHLDIANTDRVSLSPLVHFELWYALMDKYFHCVEQLLTRPDYEMDQAKLQQMLLLGKNSYRFVKNMLLNETIYTNILQKRKKALEQLKTVFISLSLLIQRCNERKQHESEQIRRAQEILKDPKQLQKLLDEELKDEKSAEFFVGGQLERFDSSRIILGITSNTRRNALTNLRRSKGMPILIDQIKAKITLREATIVNENQRITHYIQQMKDLKSAFNFYTNEFKSKSFDTDQFLLTLKESDQEIRILVFLCKGLYGLDCKVTYFDEFIEDDLKFKKLFFKGESLVIDPLMQEHDMLEKGLNQTLLAPKSDTRSQPPVLQRMSAQLKEVMVQYLKLNCLPKPITIHANLEPQHQPHPSDCNSGGSDNPQNQTLAKSENNTSQNVGLKHALERCRKMITHEERGLKTIFSIHQETIGTPAIASSKRQQLIASKISKTQAKLNALETAIQPLHGMETLYQIPHLLALVKKTKSTCLALLDFIGLYSVCNNAYGISRLNEYIKELNDLQSQFSWGNASIHFKAVFNPSFFNQVHTGNNNSTASSHSVQTKTLPSNGF